MDDQKSYDASAPTEERQPRPIFRKLALHRWEMGQVLHPAQFRAQEAALLDHIGLRAQLAGLPSYGVAYLPWSDAQLASGDLSLAGLTVVLPSGLLIDVPGNSVLTTRNLSLPPKGAGPVPVYLHVRAEPRPEDARALPPYQDDEREVRRAIYQIEISAAPRLENVQERMKLADFSFQDAAWALDAYVPPLLRIGRGTTPFLRATLDQAAAALAAFESELVKRGADSLAGGDQLFEVRRVLGAVYQTRAALADHGYGGATRTVALHPYHLFAILRDFYLGAVAPEGASGSGTPADDLAALRYQHDDLAACFDQLARRLSRSVTRPPEVSLRLPFRRDEYWFVTEEFPDELRAASEVFLLLERDAQAAAAGAGMIPLDDIKLASPLRAEEVYTKALEGVPRSQLPSLSFAQTFGADRATVLQLDSKSREWQQALAERRLCFAVLPGLEDVSAALFWKSPDHG